MADTIRADDSPAAPGATAATGKTAAAAAPEPETPYRYDAALAAEIEARWQDRWEREGTFEAPNPSGPLADPAKVAARPKRYVLDMFPYPSGIGLHVGHPLGYIATDVYGRFKRMTGHNVLHALGYDAFGLPAEQYAVQTGQHPRVTTERNIATIRGQLRRIGLAHDPRRSIATIDLGYYKWTQWIFLQIYNAWYDEQSGRARHVDELVAALDSGERTLTGGAAWADLSQAEKRTVVDRRRLAYLTESPVNWCPALGTVLANEEVTADGRSDRGNFPVFTRDLRQWSLRITAYSDRLLDDLDTLDWPEPIKLQQRNWIGRSDGARVTFPGDAGRIEVFTTRPDTLFGATFMVLAPEHPMVDLLASGAWPEGTAPSWTGGAATPHDAVVAYRAQATRKTDLERQTEGRAKTGVWTGTYATNPVNGEPIAVFVADYVLMGYGTGAIMAVPGQDERDWEFATRFGLPIVRTVQPPDGWQGEAYLGEGPAVNSSNGEVTLDGLGVADAKSRIIDWLEATGAGTRTITYRMRDWLFSRQRYWGEPFPVVFDEDDNPVALPESMLPVELPEVDDYSPQTFAEDDVTSEPQPPLSRNADWVHVTLDLGDGPKPYRRDANVMPQWAGSCWYELRYLDPTNDEALVDPEVERYWMGPRSEGDTGGVDLYVGGAEHAVLHLLYARFWHKVLFDLGHVSSREPYHKLYNQGMIQGPAYTDERGRYVEASEVVEPRPGEFEWQGRQVSREFGKIGKSLKNMVTPDDLCDQYGADTFRVYEMSMGPLDASRPWETRAVVGSHRFLQRVWRNIVDEQTGACRVVDAPADDATSALLHRTIARVSADMESMHVNTSVARLIELNNHLVKTGTTTRDVAEALVLMLAPLAPHVAEELWSRLGHDGSLAFAPFPVADPALLVEESVTCVLQVSGKVRDRIEVEPGIDVEELRERALASVAVQRALAGRTVRTVVVRAPRLANVVPV